ncbi:MAG TPA: M42 family metallopeptidase [Firmicutes bacterium]|jgi:putative aminopeptidase FrvX|nr:M42 family metallopeptidase [Bacillota bacterium]HHT42145.1 M42 family metallopeptidase [Bacillota bacterium]
MPVTFNGKELLQLIHELVSIPSPSGFTDKIIDHIAARLDGLGVSYIRNRKRGLLATIPGKNSGEERLLTAHIDTLGAMVKEIKGSGRLRLSLIGGSKWAHLEGEYCQVFTADGNTYSGTILMHQTAVHVYRDAGSAERNQDNMEVRLDARVSSADDVRELGIQVGDFVAFEPRTEILPSGFIKSRHLDDKAGAGILLYLLQEIQENQLQLPYTTHILFSNYEEIGFGGNSNIPPEVVEYVAVDMGAVGDGQTGDEFAVSICAMDSSGPYDRRLRQHLIDLAQEQSIDYRVDIYPFYASDASAALRAGHDVVHGLIGPGIDASHAFERTHVDAVINTAKLAYYYLLSEMC